MRQVATNASHAEKSIEKSTMNRIEMLKSIVQKNGNKSKKIMTEETKHEELPTKSGAQNRRSKQMQNTENTVTKENGEKRRPLSETSESYRIRSATMNEFSRPIQSSEEQRSDESQASGNKSTLVEKRSDILRQETKSEELPELSLATIRSQIWKNIHSLKSGKVDPTFVQEFTKGCNVIMRAAKLELEASKVFGSDPFKK